MFAYVRKCAYICKVFKVITRGKDIILKLKVMLKAKESVILVGYGERKYLKDLFRVSYPTVIKSLNGSVNTKLQRKIRKAAIERGGTEYQPLNK